jgi:YVTN family beta-propeller protein
MRWKIRTATVCAWLLLGACSSNEPSSGQAGSIVVTPDSVFINQLDTLRLQVSVLDTHGDLLTGVSVTFSSADTNLVRVSALGTVSSRGPAGSTAVIVRGGGIFQRVPVIIKQVADSIGVTPDPATVPQQGNVQLQAALLDLSGIPVPGAVITYVTLSPGLVTVSGGGLVHSVGPAGTGYIQLSSGSISRQATVVVTQVATSLTVSPPSVTMGPGMDVPLSAQVLDAVGAPMSGFTATFSSNNTSVATVSSAGVVHAVGPLGSATITASASGMTRPVPVTVLNFHHPLGTVVATSPLQGAAYDAKVSAGNVVYAALTGGSVARADLPGTTFSTVASPGGVPIAVDFDPSGTRAYIAGAPGDGISVINVATNTVIGTVTGLAGSVFDVAVSPDGQTIFAATDGHVYSIDATTLQVTHHYDEFNAIIHLAVHPTLQLLYASGSGSVRELNSQTLALTRTFTFGSTVQDVTVTPDASRLLVADEGGALRTVILATGVLGPSATTCGAYGIVAAQDGIVAYVSCSTGGVVQIVDLGTLTVTKTIPTTGAPRRMGLDPGGLTLVVANEGGWVDFIQ